MLYKRLSVVFAGLASLTMLAKAAPAPEKINLGGSGYITWVGRIFASDKQDTTLQAETAWKIWEEIRERNPSYTAIGPAIALSEPEPNITAAANKNSAGFQCGVFDYGDIRPIRIDQEFLASLGGLFVGPKPGQCLRVNCDERYNAATYICSESDREFTFRPAHISAYVADLMDKCTCFGVPGDMGIISGVKYSEAGDLFSVWTGVGHCDQSIHSRPTTWLYRDPQTDKRIGHCWE